MNNFRKNLVNNITLIIVLVLTFAHLVFLTLNVFGVTGVKLYQDFNYFVAYILVIMSLAMYILGFFIEKIANLKIPSWFEIVFYVAFYLFTNIYYITNAYSTVLGLIVFFAYLSFLVTIINVAIFYHTQKDEKNKLKNSRSYIVTSIFFYSVGTNAILELFISAVKAFFFPDFIFTTLTSYVVEFCAMILVTIFMCILFNGSLKKSKKLINGCLIKSNS